MSESGDTITVYSDYVCPFCYLGKHSLESYRESADDPPAVEWKPFDLRGRKRGPDGEIREDVDDGKDDEYFEQAKENVRRLQEQYGVEMSLDLSRDVDSWNAHQASLGVQREYDDETLRAFHDAVFDALWQDGRDIGDVDVLADVAEAVGVDPEDVREFVADDDLDAAVRDGFKQSQQAGVTGVPTFAYGDYGARGAVPPEQIRRLVEGE
jgi:predicted DsbA family dithiol-disulfide isomerase